jgi:hypothetical protein
MSEATFITVGGDASNRKSVKLISFVVRFIYPKKNIKIKLLGLHSVKGERLEIVVNDIYIQLKIQN